MAETQEVLQKRKNGSNGGTKILAVVSAVAATALGVFAGFSQYVTPLRQDFAVLQRHTDENFSRMRTDLREKLAPLQAHAIKGGHPDSILAKIDLLKEEVDRIRADLARHEALKGHPELVSDMAGNVEKLKEIETQFSWSSDVRDRENNHMAERLAVLEKENKILLKYMSSSQQKGEECSALLSLLWEKVFGSKQPAASAE